MKEIISIYTMGNLLGSPTFLRPILLTSCFSKLFGSIILCRLFFFLDSNSIFSPRKARFRPRQSTLDQILCLSQSVSDEFNKLKPGPWTIFAMIDFSMALILSGIPVFSVNLWKKLGCQTESNIYILRLASLLALLVDLNLSFLTSALAWITGIKIAKVAPFQSVEVFHKNSLLALFFFSFHD